MNHTDLIKGCQANDPHYQRMLVVQVSPVMMTVCRRYARDEALAKDILQESLIKVLRDIKQFKGSGSLEGWIRKIVVRTALQYIDKSIFTREQMGIEKLPEAVFPPNILDELAVEGLMKLINGLPNGYREVFNLFAVEGYSHHEIAALLQITESTSRSQLTRARKLLKQMLVEQKKTFYDSYRG